MPEHRRRTHISRIIKPCWRYFKKVKDLRDLINNKGNEKTVNHPRQLVNTNIPLAQKLYRHILIYFADNSNVE